MKKAKLPLILLGILLVVGALALVLTFVISPALNEDSTTTSAKTTTLPPVTTPPPPVTLSEAERQAAIEKLEQLQSEYGALFSFPYLESLIAGQTPPLTKRLTLDQVRQFASEHDNLDAIWDRIQNIQPYADQHMQGDRLLHIYWLDEKGDKIIAIDKRGGVRYAINYGQEVVEWIYPKRDDS